MSNLHLSTHLRPEAVFWQGQKAQLASAYLRHAVAVSAFSYYLLQLHNMMSNLCQRSVRFFKHEKYGTFTSGLCHPVKSFNEKLSI